MVPPRSLAELGDGATKGAQRKRRRQFAKTKADSQDPSTTHMSKRSKRSGPYSSTSTTKNRSRLLRLDPATLGREDLAIILRSCQALWTIGVEVLYKRAVRLRLGSEFPTSSIAEFTPAFTYIERFTRDLTIDVTASPTAQAYFQELAPYLKYASLMSLVFTLPDPSNGHRQAPSLSTLNGAPWLLLEDALCNGDSGGTLRASLRNVDLPELCHPHDDVRARFSNDHVLDSQAVLRFGSTLLQPGKFFQFAAAGRKRSLYRRASGTPARVALRVLRHIGVGTHMDYFYMRGTAIDTHDGLYRDPFLALGIRLAPTLTKLVFQDVNFLRLPGSVAASVDLSSVRSLHLMQCILLVDLFKLFILSRSGTNIEHLCIQILDRMEEDLWENDLHGFANFILSFSRLQSVSLKVCNRWTGTNEDYPGTFNIWSAHPGLRVYDADFGNDNDLDFDEMDTLASQCPGIEFYGSRDIVLGAPLQDGEWSNAFDAEAPYIAETLAVEFRALKTWKVYYNPAPIGQPFFEGYESGDDVHRLVASRLFGFFREACGEYNIKCKLNTIILVAQDVVIPDKTFLRHGMPMGLTYNF